MDIPAWLEDLGLGQHAQAFRDNDIDAVLLPTLTADDLRELGVTSLGHRKRLLAAIAALTGPADARALPAPLAPLAPRSGSMPSQAERRQLTVMFVDLVGSTTLAADLDPEDMAEVIRAFQDACAGVITRFEGMVAQYVGDGVLAYFGYPRAHEDDAERAVRAGLDLVDAVGRLTPRAGSALQVRVGIATGLVVVGDVAGKGGAREDAVVGGTPNLAARLQALAAPGAVLISPTTRQLIAGSFECADLGIQPIKGLAETVRVWRVFGASRAESRVRDCPLVVHVGAAVGRDHDRRGARGLGPGGRPWDQEEGQAEAQQGSAHARRRPTRSSDVWDVQRVHLPPTCHLRLRVWFVTEPAQPGTSTCAKMCRNALVDHASTWT